jgi:hypothetical protein
MFSVSIKVSSTYWFGYGLCEPAGCFAMLAGAAWLTAAGFVIFLVNNTQGV